MGITINFPSTDSYYFNVQLVSSERDNLWVLKFVLCILKSPVYAKKTYMLKVRFVTRERDLG